MPVVSTTSDSSFWEDLKAGLIAIIRNQTVSRLFLLVVGWSIGGSGINVLISVMAYQVFQMGSQGMGMFYPIHNQEAALSNK